MWRDKFHLQPAVEQPFLGWRIASMVLLGFLAACFIGSSYLIYRYVYRTLQDAYVILGLSANPDTEALNRPLFEQVRKLIAQKKAGSIIPRDMRYIFQYGQATSTPKTGARAAR